LTGCGGSSSSSSTSSAASSGDTGSSSSGGGSTLNTDVQAVNKAVQGYTASSSAVGTAATDPASWDQLSQGAKKAADTITGLTAPASLQSEQQALATTLNQISDTATKVATDLRNNDATAAQADLAAAKAASQAYQAAGAAWTAAAKSAAGS
jgi:hypothetical protein